MDQISRFHVVGGSSNNYYEIHSGLYEIIQIQNDDWNSKLHFCKVGKPNYEWFWNRLPYNGFAQQLFFQVSGNWFITLAFQSTDYID